MKAFCKQYITKNGENMASSKEYLDYVLEQCDGLYARAMMGEYVLYFGGKVVGGIYDNRLLIKPTPAAVKLLKNALRELPYEGAKEMLLVEDIENRDFLKELFEAMYPELPEPKRKNKQTVNSNSRLLVKIKDL